MQASESSSQQSAPAPAPAAVAAAPSAPNFSNGDPVDPAATEFDGNGWAVDADLALLAALCPKVVDINLSCCNKITDAGLQHVAQLTALQELNLTGCDKITDAGLQHVAQLTALQQLNLRYCKQITVDAKHRFQQQHPTCQVSD